MVTLSQKYYSNAKQKQRVNSRESLIRVLLLPDQVSKMNHMENMNSLFKKEFDRSDLFRRAHKHPKHCDANMLNISINTLRKRNSRTLSTQRGGKQNKYNK